MIRSPSSFLHNLLLFARLLRAHGLRVTSERIAELASSLRWIDVGNREDFRAAARCLLVSRHEDDALFDCAFDAFWRVWSDVEAARPPELTLRLTTNLPQEPSPGVASESSIGGGRRTLRAGEPDRETDGEEGDAAIAIYSGAEALRQKDFALFNDDEILEARRFMSSMRWTLAQRRSRRVRPSRRGSTLDVRRSLRRSLGHGGELFDLARRGPKLKRRQLVLLCDISGSMERYTRLLLHFLHAIEASALSTEVFLFGTRLTRITRQLRHRDPDAALRAVAGEVRDWSGGTRIGASLHVFNQRWARRVLGHGAIVLIISDGWDRGDPAELAAEMARLQRASYRLIWLNPLLGSAGYQPVTQGIRAALPYVDDFLPVHNLHSLASLAAVLDDIQDQRPERRQSYSGGIR